MRIIPLVLLWAASSTLRADVSVFRGPAGGVGDVVVLGESGLEAPVELQGIQLLSLDFVGRSTLTELLPDHPRLRADVPSAGRIVLPSGRGSLYRYRRGEPLGGPAIFGFFWVDAAGRAQSVWEAAGTGVTATDDPILGRVSIDSAGEAFLFATTVAAGGDLIEVDLAARTAINRTSSLGAQSFKPAGVCLLADWGVGITSGGVFRFHRLPGQEATIAPIPGGTPVYFDDGIVKSGEENAVAFVAGSAQTLAHVYRLRHAGSARRVTSAPAHLTGAGFLPDCPAGPTLALSPDGSLCAWRTEGASRECWVRPVVSSGPSAELQITADARFADTLNDAGTLGFISIASILLLVGEHDPVTHGIEGADAYRLELGKVRHIGGSVSFSIQNLTMTSGDSSAPFLEKGQIKTEGGLYRLPGDKGLLAHLDLSGGTGALIRADWSLGAVETVLDDVKSLEGVEAAGAHLFLTARRDLADDPVDLLRLPVAFGTTTDLIARLPDGTLFDRSAAQPTGTVAAVARVGTDEWTWRGDLPALTGELLAPQPQLYGPTIGYLADGSLVLSIVMADGNSQFVSWAASGAASTLPIGPFEGFFLPGI